MALLAVLARELARRGPRRHTYRFLWSPGTIGPLVWLSRNRDLLPRVRAGLVAMCVGDPGPLHYKRSRRGDTWVDRAAAVVVRDRGGGGRVLDWVPYGGDERQFCSPGFDLPVGVLTRTPPGGFPENHTSDDDMRLMSPGALGDSLDAYLDVVRILETDLVHVSTSPYGEPQLGRRGLYAGVGGPHRSRREMATLWLLSLCDGRHGLLDVAERSGLPYADLLDAVGPLVDAGLLTPGRPGEGQ
jgi:aminopeptidase-like protein